MKIFFENF